MNALSGVVAGTRDDLSSERSLAALAPFFGSEGAAARFVSLALEQHWSALGPVIRSVDVGGAEGIVAQALLREAARRGVICDVLVLDANPRFLSAAAERGLATRLGTPADLEPVSAELVLLRFVNHYQSALAQRTLAQQIARALVPAGLLAAQIHTAAPEVCALFDEVAGGISGDAVGSGRHWAPLDEFIEVFERAGLRRLRVIGADIADEVELDDLVDDAWARVHGQALSEQLRRGQASLAAALLSQRDQWRARARQLAQNRGLSRRVSTQQPILVMQAA